MKKIKNFIRNNMWIFILLNLLLGGLLTMLSEHAVFLGFSTATSLILYSLSTRSTNVLKKYNIENKTLTHFIITTIVFILSAILVILDQLVFKLDLFSHIFGLIAITIYLIIMTIFVLTSKSSKFKLKFFFKSIKYLLSSIVGYIFTAAFLEEAYYGNFDYYTEDIMGIVLVFYLVFLTSPLYEVILEKLNKGFGKIKRFIIPTITINVLLLILLLSEIFYDISETIINIIMFGTPIIILILFILFTKTKYNDVKKIGFFKSLLIKTLIIILNIFIILYGIKIVFVVSYNRNNGEYFTTEKVIETKKIEPRELIEGESYIQIKEIKMKNAFQNVNITYDSQEYSTGFASLGGKGGLVTVNNYTWEDSAYSSLFEKYIFRDVDSYYELLELIYKNGKKGKLSIFDNMKTIYASYVGYLYNYKIDEIELGNYKGFLVETNSNRKTFSIELFDLNNIEIGYGITLFGYEKEEVLDIISTIKIERKNIISLDLYKNANIKDYTSLSIYDIEEDLNYNYKCLDDIEENEICKNATISINNKEYNIGKLHLLKNDNYHILINNYKGYSTLQIVNNIGEELLNIKFQELVKQNDVYIPYSLRYDSESEKLYYYELINDEYIYKSLDLNTFKIENIK